MGGAGGTDGETEAGAARLPLSCANSRAQSCTGLQGVGLRECPAFHSVPEYPTSITESGQSPLRALPTGQADAFHRTGLGPAALCGRRYDPPFNREQGSLGKRQRGRPRRTPAFAWRQTVPSPCECVCGASCWFPGRAEPREAGVGRTRERSAPPRAPCLSSLRSVPGATAPSRGSHHPPRPERLSTSFTTFVSNFVLRIESE